MFVPCSISRTIGFLPFKAADVTVSLGPTADPRSSKLVFTGTRGKCGNRGILIYRFCASPAWTASFTDFFQIDYELLKNEVPCVFDDRNEDGEGEKFQRQHDGDANALLR